MKTIRKIVILTILCSGFNKIITAQCNASFTYTTSSSSISATSTSTGTTSTSSYNWTLSNASGNFLTGSTSGSPVFNSLYNGTYHLYLSLIDSFGCSSTSATQTITISGGANAPACASSFTYSIGSVGSVTFTNTSPSDPYGNNVYYMDFGDGLYTNIANATHTYYYDSTYIITFNIQNPISACSSTSTQTIVINNAHPIPTCTAAFTYTIGSAGQVSFTGSYTGSASINTYNWNFGNGTSLNTQNPVYTYPYNGTYTVNLYIQDSLAACYSNTSQVLTITNAATAPCTPTVTFNMHQDSLNPQPGVWEISAYYSPQVTNAVWNWGDGTSSAGFAPTHNYSAAGQYTICVTVYSSCGDSSTVCQNDSLYRINHNNNPNSVISVTVINENGTGIKDNSTSDRVAVYPNPGSGVVKLQINNISSASNDARINVTNVLGEVVFSSSEKVSGNNFVSELDLQSLSNGSYFLKVDLGGRIYTNKFVIAK